MKEASVCAVRGLSVSLREKGRLLPALVSVDFQVKKGGCTGIIGESGCGKSLLCKAVLGLLPPEKWRVQGDVLLDGERVPLEDGRAMDAFRGRRMSMVMQDPLPAFDPRMTIGAHFLEGCRRSRRAARRQEAVQWLKRMYIQEPESVLKRYPFELSGGMLQRALIALSLLTEPELLIADEPTTALDSTVQAELLRLLAGLQAERRISLLLVSHDLKVISRMADTVYVLYAGRVVEYGPMEEVRRNPLHPYTAGLFRSAPAYSKERLSAMAGRPPRLGELDAAGCPFAPRCPEKAADCAACPPGFTEPARGHFVSCRRTGGTP